MVLVIVVVGVANILPLLLIYCYSAIALASLGLWLQLVALSWDVMVPLSKAVSCENLLGCSSRRPLGLVTVETWSRPHACQTLQLLLQLLAAGTSPTHDPGSAPAFSFIDISTGRERVLGGKGIVKARGVVMLAGTAPHWWHPSLTSRKARHRPAVVERLLPRQALYWA